jgi:hypothetical protein
MTRNLLVAVSGTLLLLAAACGDSDDDGTGGSGGSTSSGTTSTSGSGGGGGSCLSCGDYVSACIIDCPAGVPQELVCADGSWDLLNALNACICGASEGDCEADCPARCTESGEDGANCMACQGAAVADMCQTQFNGCMADM